MADPNQEAAEKLDRETKAEQAKQQANADKTWENLHEGKIQPPTENDMGPLPKKSPKKYKKGGKVSQLAKANGCAVKGKSKGRII